MALKECKECGKQVSTEAESCPHCGVKDPVEDELWVNIITGVLVIIVFGWIYSTVIASDPAPETPWDEQVDEIGAYVMMQDFVKDRLRSPSTAEFPYSAEASIEYLGDQKYKVSSYVDSENGFGATVRTRYSGTIEQAEKDRWKLIDLNTN